MLSRTHRRAAGGGSGCQDHPAGRQGPGAARWHSHIPGLTAATRDAALGAEPIGSASKAAMGSGALRSQLGSSGSAAPPVPPTAHRPDPPAQRQRGFSCVPPLPPPFVFYLVLLFSSLWSFVPACPLFQRLWFLVPLMLCHSLHLGAFLSPGFEAGGCFLSLLCAWHFYPFSCLVHSWVTRARPGLSSNPHLSCVGAGFPCLYVLS